jgi:hypothetical protein
MSETHRDPSPVARGKWWIIQQFIRWTLGEEMPKRRGPGESKVFGSLSTEMAVSEIIARFDDRTNSS